MNSLLFDKSIRDFSLTKLICLINNEKDFSIEKLKELFQNIILFNNCDQFLEDLNQSRNEKIFLIISDQYESSFLHQIEQIESIWSILIYHENNQYDQRTISSKVNSSSISLK